MHVDLADRYTPLGPSTTNGQRIVVTAQDRLLGGIVVLKLAPHGSPDARDCEPWAFIANT